MNFVYLNIQVLDFLKDNPEIGRDGYMHIFRDFMSGTKIHYAAKESSYEEKIFTMENISIEPHCATGYLVKKDLEKEFLKLNFKNRKNHNPTGIPGIYGSFYFYFVFSFDFHTIAIEVNKELPYPKELKIILKSLVLEALVPSKLRRGLDVKCAVINKYQEIDSLIGSALLFFEASIETTFTNSFDFIDKQAKKLQEELKENGIYTVKHEEKSGLNGRIKKLSTIALLLIALSAPAGFANFKLIDKFSEVKTIDTDDLPIILKISPRHKGVMTERDVRWLNMKIISSIKLAVEMSTGNYSVHIDEEVGISKINDNASVESFSFKEHGNDESS